MGNYYLGYDASNDLAGYRSGRTDYPGLGPTLASLLFGSWQTGMDTPSGSVFEELVRQGSGYGNGADFIAQDPDMQDMFDSSHITATSIFDSMVRPPTAEDFADYQKVLERTHRFSNLGQIGPVGGASFEAPRFDAGLVTFAESRSGRSAFDASLGDVFGPAVAGAWQDAGNFASVADIFNATLSGVDTNMFRQDHSALDALKAAANTFVDGFGQAGVSWNGMPGFGDIERTFGMLANATSAFADTMPFQVPSTDELAGLSRIMGIEPSFIR